MRGKTYTSVERNFLPEVSPDVDLDQVRCMSVLRVWRHRPSDGNVQLMVRGAEATRVVTLNSTGSFLWQLAEDHPTLQQLVERFATEFQLPWDRALRDVLAFVNSMIAGEHLRAVPS